MRMKSMTQGGIGAHKQGAGCLFADVPFRGRWAQAQVGSNISTGEHSPTSQLNETTSDKRGNTLCSLDCPSLASFLH